MALWHADNYGTMANVACWTLAAIMTVTVALRLWCRIAHGSIGLDDHITVFCVVVILVTCVLVTIGSNYGLGQHIATLSPEQIEQSLRWNIIISSVLVWTFSLPKFALVAILKRILNYGTKTAVVFWGLAITSQALIFVVSIWWWKQCDPVEYGWNQSIKGKCAPISVMADLGYFTSAYSAFLDLLFSMYPIPFIMRLRMPLRNRIAVSIALGLSSLAFIISIYKLAIFGQVFEVMAKDPTYPVPYLDILGVAEGCILIICASLPTLGPLYRLCKGKLTTLGSSERQSSHPISGTDRQESGKWGRLKGHSLEDGDAEQASTGVPSSVDDIPLVPAAAMNHGTASDIHKKMEFSVKSKQHY